MGLLSLRPGDSLTIPKMALSVGFIRFVFSTDTTQAKGLLTFAPIGLPPTKHVYLSWTHSLATMLSGANAFEISDIQEDETEAAIIRRAECNNVTLELKPLNGVFGKDS